MAPSPTVHVPKLARGAQIPTVAIAQAMPKVRSSAPPTNPIQPSTRGSQSGGPYIEAPPPPLPADGGAPPPDLSGDDGVDEALAAADEVAPSNAEDGVAVMIERVLAG